MMASASNFDPINLPVSYNYNTALALDIAAILHSACMFTNIVASGNLLVKLCAWMV
jgi:hypothetical protein